MTLAETWSWIGSTTFDDGDLRGAERSFEEVTRLLKPLHDSGENVRATDLLGRNMIFQANAQLGLGKVDLAAESVGQGVAIYADLTVRDPQNASWSRSAHRAGLTQLGLTTPGQWTPAQARALQALVAGLAGLAAQDPTNAGVVLDLSHGLRLQALRALATDDPAAALAAAGDAHARMTALVAATDYSAQRLAELARAAEVLGTAQAAAGDYDAALATWREAAARLDREDQRTFEFIPVRRLLAISLGQSRELAALQVVLDQAGYRDPRMEPAFTLTGDFRPEQDTTRGPANATF